MSSMRVLITLLLISFTSNLWAQDSQPKDHTKNIAIIQSFIKDLANENKAVDIVLSKYLIVENPSDEIYDYLEVSLEEVRINLLSKDIKEINYIPYNQMPTKDIKDIDPEDLDTAQMYFLHYRKRQMLAVYMENGKIASFTLVSKGNNKAHFVLY
ncbi:hypothetical protein SAMN05660841_00620 [Sphingobacterium nematocida]|uniref:Intein N-terminal splicing region n=2 Tax=Sphingobacterium nematocida TaxID=1513896 RepID=A0A1T5BFA3_9SPHI|nr:hypothetical protein SAMN05660841_00620 [Sphingobacterium nematocida]